MDLVCDNDECTSCYKALNTVSETDTSARAHGWRVWRHQDVTLILCPTCVGHRVRRDPVPERLEGEQPLF